MAPRQSNADKEKREKEKDDVRKLLNTEKPKKVELGGLKPLNAGVRAILLAWRAVWHVLVLTHACTEPSQEAPPQP